jgi:hypothetical protein
MKQKRKYYNTEWYNFSNKIKDRNGNKCYKCARKEPEVVLQIHHKIYKPNLKPWEYPVTDCIILCKGCRAREHGLIEPDSGWTLVSVEDLGGLYGICERTGCGTEIRYKHVTYHPKWGYKNVGSTCVEHLTSEDKFFSLEVVKVFKKISDFLNKSTWEQGKTKKGIEYLFTTHAHHQIRIYGNENFYSYQIVLKKIGERWFDFKKIINTKNKNLEHVKELGYIVLRGLITESKTEKEILRNIYKQIK